MPTPRREPLGDLVFHNGQALAYAISRMSWAGDQRPSYSLKMGVADRGEYRQAAGAANKPAGCIIKVATSEGLAPRCVKSSTQLSLYC
jgi:hypothetical protein